MSRSVLLIVTFFSLAVLLCPGSGLAGVGECYDPGGACTEPCPCTDACYVHEDCPEGLVCLPGPLSPVVCVCNSETGRWWSPSEELAGMCYDWPEPTGPPTHTIIDLGTLGGPEAHANGVNNYGQVVGEAGLPGWPYAPRHAFLWDQGVMTDLCPESGTDWSWAVDINNIGQIVVNSDEHAFLWDNGSLIPLGGLQPVARYATGHAVNDRGQVVGVSDISHFEYHAFLWEDGAMFDLGTLGGSHSLAWDINQPGQVVGSSFTGSGEHAFLWSHGAMTDLGNLGAGASEAFGINDLTQIIGTSQRPAGRPSSAFLWEDGIMHDLGELTGRDPEYALAINDCGEILLRGDGTAAVDYYVYQRGRVLRQVRGVMGPTTGWYGLHVKDMNDAGQIVGWGSPFEDGRSRAFLMSPIPGDLDGDGDTDLQDYSEFAGRVTGPLEPGIPGCERADIDRDADVDLIDFALFHAAVTGAR